MTAEQAFQQALVSSKRFTRESLLGGGALVGKNVKISSIVPIDGGNRITFSYTMDDGTERTSSLDVMDGKDGKDGRDGKDGSDGLPGTDGDNGVGITGVEKINSAGFIDTYRITLSNGEHHDYVLKNGEPGRDGYPFLIYKEYTDISGFNASDFPEVGLMFMIDSEQDGGFPVYRYTGDPDRPYSYITSLKGSEPIKGEPGRDGEDGKDGEQGIPGQDGKDGTTYTPKIGNVVTVPYGDPAAASVSVDEETKEAVFDFSIPAGRDGGAAGDVDDELSLLSENPVQNKIVTKALAEKGSTLSYDEDSNELQLKSGDTILSTVEIRGGTSSGGFRLAKPTDISLKNADEAVTIRWTDPPDLVINGATLAEWAGTLVVRKVGSPPNSKTDGTIVIDSKTRDSYREDGFSDTGLTNGVRYFYGIFPYTIDGVYTYGATEDITPTAIYPDAPKNVSVRTGDSIAVVSFTLPENAVSAKIAYSTQQPASTAEPYGTVISNAESPYTIAGLTNDIRYYVTVYSANARGRETAGEMLPITPKVAVLYGLVLNQKDESDPASMIEYIEDNKDFTPAHMDYENDRFDYGSWGDAWFIRDLRPCMLNYDGTVAYELDPNDYTKKKDGTPSDVANADFPGNAMVGIPKVYWKIVDNGDDTANIYICDTKLDDDFVCWSHIDNNGNEIPYCYMPIYGGTLVSGVLRSLSGLAPTTNLSHIDSVNGAEKNDPSDEKIWNIETYPDFLLISILTVLVGKTTDSQKAFGRGNSDSGKGDASGIYRNGTMDGRGIFWGSRSPAHGVKIFGMENLWGNEMRALAGIAFDGQFLVKMTYGTSDGSTAEGYDAGGRGYQGIGDIDLSFMGTSELYGYIKRMKCSPKGFFPIDISGAAGMYHCDWAMFPARSATGRVCIKGGTSNYGDRNGCFFCSLHMSKDSSYWGSGASLSCRPLAQTGGGPQ